MAHPPRWRNWSGSVRATPQRIARPRDAGEVADLVRGLAGRTLRVAASGHSFSPIAASDDVMATLADMPTLVEPAPDGRTVTASAGTTIRQLNARLADHGLALRNAGDIDHQTIAGALATGTHGTGLAFGPMHADLVGVELVDARGEISWIDGTGTDEGAGGPALEAARLALGTLGVVTRVRLAVVPAYRLATHVSRVLLDDVLTDLDHHLRDHRHAEFYWLPHTRWTQLKLADATDEPALPTSAMQRINDVVLENAAIWAAGQVARTFPGASAAVSRLLARGIADVQSRLPSHAAFASTRWVRFQEMEYSLPADALVPVLEALDALITAERLPVALPVEVRAVAADRTAWLSPAWGPEGSHRMYVAIHAFRGMPYTRYFRRAEAIFRSHGGRPHWGKVHTLAADDLQGLYPRFADFAAERERSDPDGVFLSPYLARILSPTPSRCG
ncbi:D-arabinono-1,4-lactone oxidase [Euzebya sp.]|uniref:D-arabinono-1,4-lactone oxidase n=1 Tax=Euzebya sp. TaxID=1971409 RepID=UPI00351301AA